MAKFNVGDLVSVSGKAKSNRYSVTEVQYLNHDYTESPTPIYLCKPIEDPFASECLWAHSALRAVDPQKYRVVLETENPDQFKMLNGSTFISSEAVR